MTVGVLAIQGDFAEHLTVLQSLGVHSKEVRTVDDLQHVHKLIIPGGESTVMSRFLQSSGLMKEIRARVKEETLPIFGTCAGAILLAKKVTGKHAPETLGVMDIEIERNAYGSQMESFEESIKVKSINRPVDVAFIRAPIITQVGKSVDVLGSVGKTPIIVRQGQYLAATCHPEVRGETAVHELFLAM